jgi:hypothetical protein
MGAAAGLLEEGDLQLLSQTLRLACSVVTATPPAAAAPALAETVLPRVVRLSASSSVQGSALAALLAFLSLASRALPAAGGAAGDAFAFNTLLPAVLAAATAACTAAGSDAAAAAGLALPSAAKNSVRTAAKAVAALCAQAAPAHRDPVIATFITRGTSAPHAAGAAAGAEVSAAYLALQSLGEVGHAVDVLAVDPAAATKLGALLSGASGAVDPAILGATAEDVKAAAAFALGGVCVGSPATALPVLLSGLSASLAGSAAAAGAAAGAGAGGASAAASSAVSAAAGAANEGAYLYLAALRDVLLSHAPALRHGPDFSRHVPAVQPVLLSHAACGAAEEGIRNMGEWRAGAGAAPASIAWCWMLGRWLAWRPAACALRLVRQGG